MASRIGRHFSFTLISATDLPDVRNFGHMKVYAKVSIRNNDVANSFEQKTSVDELNGTNPEWNSTFNYWVLQSNLEDGMGSGSGLGPMIEVKFYCQRTFGNNKYIGHVNIDLKQFYKGTLISNIFSMDVLVGVCQSKQGTVDFSLKFGDLESVEVEEVNEKVNDEVEEMNANVVEVEESVENDDDEDEEDTENVNVEVGGNEQSFVEVVAKKTATSIIAHGIKNILIEVLS